MCLPRGEGKASRALAFPGAPPDARVHYSFSTTSAIRSTKGAPRACACVRAWVRSGGVDGIGERERGAGGGGEGRGGRRRPLRRGWWRKGWRHYGRAVRPAWRGRDRKKRNPKDCPPIGWNETERERMRERNSLRANVPCTRWGFLLVGFKSRLIVELVSILEALSFCKLLSSYKF